MQEGALKGLSRLPSVPDPLPAAPSAALPAGTVLEAGPTELGDAHEHLTSALKSAGFANWSVYAYRDGFALVTQWEKIEDDGQASTKRFPVRHPRHIRAPFDFDKHAQLLFNAPNGTYRMFVFTVAGTSSALSGAVPIDGDEVGVGELPEELGGQSSAGQTADVHVYVFHQEGSDKAEQLTGFPLDAKQHLAHAGIFNLP
jgi:hypothetical protein